MVAIHVNQHVIRANQKTGSRNPALTVKRGRTNTYAHEVGIIGPDGRELARVVYRPDKPLSCGARCWVETDAPLRFYDASGAETAGAAAPCLPVRRSR